MHPPIRISGVGIARSPGRGVNGAGEPGPRLSAALAALPQAGSPARLFFPIEEMAFLAAYEALSSAGVHPPVGGEDTGIALGVDEGIDGIKARYFEAVLRDGPLGASPMAFPFTTPNTITARISILLDLRGESLTICGGSLSGAQAIGLAVEALREGRCGAVLAGGATSVEQEFLDALDHLGRPDGGQVRCGACLLLLEPRHSTDEAGETAGVIGYAEGFGRDAIRDAVQGCVEDAGLFPGHVKSVRAASANGSRLLGDVLRRLGVSAPIVRSPASDLYSASFPAAVAETAGELADGAPGPALVVGADCLAGASAALLRGGAR